MIEHFLEIDDLDAASLARVLDRAQAWKRERIPKVLDGRAAVLFFEKPSARTRVSTDLAVHSLGGYPVYVRGEEVGLEVRESTADVARTFGSFCDLVCARVFDDRTLRTFAGCAGVPVVNLLSDVAHPCQALADLVTLRDALGALEGARVAYIGDGNNVAASLALGAALTGVELAVATPVGYELTPEVLARARDLGGEITTTSDPYAAVRGVDAVYTDVWTSMGQEAEVDRRRVAFAGFQVDAALMEVAGEGAIFLHCLPAHRGEEVAADVIDGPRSRVWEQAANRMHAVRALLPELIDVEGEVDART